MNKPLDGYEHLNYVDPKSIAPFSTQLNTLKNGLRVATEPNFGEYATVGRKFLIFYKSKILKTTFEG